jgi:hypothetical protein
MVSMLLMLGFFAFLDAWNAMVPHGEVAVTSQDSNARAYLSPIAYGSFERQRGVLLRQ